MKLAAADLDVIRLRFAQVMQEARRLYPPLAATTVQLKLDLRGRAAGQARYGHAACTIRLNPEAYALDRTHLLNETIPHEVAHVVAFVTRLGHGHDAGWRRIARSLGCKGNRCHSIPLTPRGGGFTYVATCGTRVVLTKAMHTRIQMGQQRRVARTGGLITHAQHVAA